MKVIVIGYDKTLSYAEVNGYQDGQEIVMGLIQPIDLSFGTLYVNDEGLFRFTSEQVNWIAADVCGLGGQPQFMFGRPPLLGPAYLIGPLDPEGDHTDVTEKGERAVKRVAREAGGRWAA